MTRKHLAKLVVACLLLPAAISCTSILDKKYNPSSFEEDYKELARELSSEDLQLIKNCIQDPEETEFCNSTYKTILLHAQFKIEEEKRIAIKKAEIEKEKAEMEKQLQPKKELLCNKKWKLKSMEYVMPAENDSVYTIKMTNAAVDLFSKKIKKIYASDGTYQEIAGKEVTQEGTWSFVSLDKIEELRTTKSGTQSHRNKSEVYFLTIQKLNEKEFTFIEENSRSYYSENGTMLKLITLEPQ